MEKTKGKPTWYKALSVAMALVLALGLTPMPRQAYADVAAGSADALTTQAESGELADGTYNANGLSTAVLSMYHFHDAQVVVKGDNAWLITTEDTDNTVKRFDGMAYGPQSEILDASDEANRTLVAGTPTAAVVPVYGEDGETLVTRTFVLPVPKSVIAAGADIYYMIKYVEGYSDAHDGDWYKATAGDYYLTGYTLEKVSDDTTLPDDADYTAVEAALAKVPTDLSIYTDETAQALTDAVDAVEEGKKIDEQAEVDAMAKAIEDAIAALKLTPAAQAAVDKAAAEEAQAAADTAKAEAEAAADKAAKTGSAADAAAAYQAAQKYEAAAKAAKEAADKAVESAKAEGSGVSADDLVELEKAATAASENATAAAAATETAKSASEKATKGANLSNATITVAGGTYTGKALTPVVTVKDANGKKLAAGTDYTVAYKNNTNAGTATVTVTGKGNYAGSSKTANFTIAKAAGSITAKAAKKTLAAKAKKKTTIKAAKAFKVTANASKGKVTYKKTKGNKKITVAANGKITVKKGLKKGKTYTIKVKATSAATANYNAATSKVFNVKIKVK